MKFQDIDKEIKLCDQSIFHIDAQLKKLKEIANPTTVSLEFSIFSGAPVSTIGYIKLLEESRKKFDIRREGLIEARETMDKIFQRVAGGILDERSKLH